MSFINWSDAEEMIGLLREYVADERSESPGDRPRNRLLGALLDDLADLAASEPEPRLEELIDRMREIESAHERLRGDRVHEHLLACIEELERIDGGLKAAAPR